MRARNRVGIALSYWPAGLHRLAESIPDPLKSLKIPPLLHSYKRKEGNKEKCPMGGGGGGVVNRWEEWDDSCAKICAKSSLIQ